MGLSEWVRAARAHADMTLQHLGDAIGRTKGAVGHWEQGKNEPGWELIEAVSRVTGYPLPGHQVAGVAHQLSPTPFDTPVLLGLEELMAGTAYPQTFRAALPDGALAPEYPQGLELVWSTTKVPQVGSLVLVRTAHGQVAARQYRQGKTPGQWIAAATVEAFASFNSQDDGLQVLAVAVWRPMP